jgi:ribonuclease P protein component
MTLSVLKHPECAGIRVGIVTSRRVGNAVERNTVRRRLREIVRLQIPALRPGCWLVLIARKSAVAATFAALREEWLRLAARASILTSEK